MWRHVTDFKRQDVLAVGVYFSVSCFPTLLYGFFVFFLGLFFFLDDSLNPRFSELSCELVDAGIRVDREVVLHFQELVGGVEVMLSESDVGDGVDYL